eukprot:TRINITY_DN20842_c0_g1_i1.p1 TRINITY_DN20842_c0_g1~~TRINITY_DN20842_c0_g1_i1.p1  ORF type:complete len:286 (+),score=67.85 TRINITY_DN20842_c0_g1_i1:80-937(+)
MLKRGRQLCTLEALRTCANVTSEVMNLERLQQLMAVLPGMLVPRWVALDPANSKSSSNKARSELMWEILEQPEGGDPAPITVQTRARFQSAFHEALEKRREDSNDVELAGLPEKPALLARLTPMEKIQQGASRAPSQIGKALESAITQRRAMDAAPVLGDSEKPVIRNKALSELDPALVEKARQLAKHRQEDVQAGHQTTMRAASKLSRLTTICPVVRTLFRSKKKKALPFVEVVRHVAQAQRVNSTPVEVKELLRKLVEIVPAWCSLKTHALSLIHISEPTRPY